MRARRHVVGCAAALFASALLAGPAVSETREGRAETQTYATGLGVRTGHEGQGLGLEEDIGPPLVFRTERGERSVTLTVADTAGYPVLVRVQQAGERGRDDLWDEFCGTEQTYRLVSDEPFEVYLYSGFCLNHNWGLATSGSVTATFSTARGPRGSHPEHDH